MSEELKPCPFCGSDAIAAWSPADDEYLPECSSVSCERGRTVESWNTRPAEVERLKAENEELAKELNDLAEYHGYAIEKKFGNL